MTGRIEPCEAGPLGPIQPKWALLAFWKGFVVGGRLAHKHTRKPVRHDTQIALGKLSPLFCQVSPTQADKELADLHLL